MSGRKISLTDAARPLFLGMDIGGTSIKLGLVDEQGRTLAYEKFPTEHKRGSADALQRMARAVEQIIGAAGANESDIAGIGVGAPGPLDIPGGRMLHPHNLPGWGEFAVRDELSEATGFSAVFNNDANVAAYGEFWMGAGRDYDSLVLITLGTGVGSGIIINDEIVQGEHSHGSECGHIVIDISPHARVCPCGKRGHLEAYCSATSLVARTIEELNAGRESSLHEYRQIGGDLDGLAIAKHAEGGDQLAFELVMETAHLLGLGIVSIMNTVDPAAFALGGAMNFGGRENPLGRQFLDRVRRTVRQNAFPVPGRKTIIDFATLGGDAGYLGAAGMARRAHARDKA